MEQEELKTDDAKSQWDAAIGSDNYVRINVGVKKIVALTNWKIEKKIKFDDECWVFTADATREDGKDCAPAKIFETTSNRLKKALRPFFEGKDPSQTVVVEILRVGEQFETQYHVEEVK